MMWRRHWTKHPAAGVATLTLVVWLASPAVAHPRPGRTERASEAPDGSPANSPLAGFAVLASVAPAAASSRASLQPATAGADVAPRWVRVEAGAPAVTSPPPRTAAGTGAALEGQPSASARPGRTERVSIASDGTQANNFSFDSAVSADGRYIAFLSNASNLVPGDTNDAYDIFVRDRVTGMTERVSVASDGAEANAYSLTPSLSADGRYVSFYSSASNLVPGGGIWPGVFVHDRATGATQRVSVSSDGTPGNHLSYWPKISGDGRYVAFSSFATDLVPGDTNAASDIYVHDRVNGTTDRVIAGGIEGNGYAFTPSISYDGRYVAFLSAASNLVPGDRNNTVDVFFFDRETQTIERVSVATDGSEQNDWAMPVERPILSDDGRYVAFESLASNLVPADANSVDTPLYGTDIFVRDRVAGTTERVSVAGDGAEGRGYVAVGSPAMSADGRLVAFASSAPNLVAGDSNNALDVFVHDRLTGETELISQSSTGTPGALGSYNLSMSADGRFVSFGSYSSNLVAGDSNTWFDVFIRDRGPGLGVGAMTASPSTEGVVVSGWARFWGTLLSWASDERGEIAAAPAGADLTGASIVYRPETDDLLVSWDVTGLPGLRQPGGAGGVGPDPRSQFFLPGVGGAAPGVAGAPAVVYDLEFKTGGSLFVVRSIRVAGTPSPPAAPYFALHRCDPGCREVARLSGGYGTTGDEVRVAIPLQTIPGLGESGSITDTRARTGLGEATTGIVQVLDERPLPDGSVPVREVRLGIAAAGTPEDGIAFDTPAELSLGHFAGLLATPPSGDYEVWARACLGEECGAASVALAGI